MGLTKTQQGALKLLTNGENIFITGDAGTGKTYLLNYFLSKHCEGKNVLRCAYTALAADNIPGGRTIHSAFRIKEYPTVKDRDFIPMNDVDNYDIIIIDEISMCRIDLFEGLLRAITIANNKRMLWGFKPIQLILCGDFFQLPPITPEGEMDAIGKIYGKDENGQPKVYPFESPEWDTFGIKTYFLRNIVRQSDNVFISCLNNIKFNKDTVNTLKTIASKSSKTPFDEDKAINLFASNKKVNACNMAHLAKLPGKPVEFAMKLNDKFATAIKEGKVRPSEMPVEEKVYLKPGAKVLFTMNDQNKKPRRFQNGSFGIVKAIDNDSVTVEVIHDEGNQLVTLARNDEKYVWNVYDDPHVSKQKKVLQNPEPKSAWQIPLKLAYAITIHKSQGQTYDYVNFDPKEDEMELQNGQLYVLLSRLTKLEGLHIVNPIDPKQCKTSAKVLKFFKKYYKEM